MTSVLKRQAATQACMDRFDGKSLIWGQRDCGKLAAHALHHMGRRAPLLTRADHKSAAAAVKYIRRKGLADLVELMDETLGFHAQIPAAAALPADIVALASEPGDGFGCSLAVMLDNGRALALNPTTLKFEPVIPHIFVTAWRV